MAIMVCDAQVNDAKQNGAHADDTELVNEHGEAMQWQGPTASVAGRQRDAQPFVWLGIVWLGIEEHTAHCAHAAASGRARSRARHRSCLATPESRPRLMPGARARVFVWLGVV